MVLEFGDFRLDYDAQTLARNGEPIDLRRKTWEVLRYLCARPGQLVSREELAEAVWGDVVVADEVVSATVRELRRALGEPLPVIETIRGRGFRFVGQLIDPGAVSPESPTAPAPMGLAGRSDALRRLHDAWEEAQHSWRHIVFVTGSSGIGKTALVDSFLAELECAGSPRFALGRGDCDDDPFSPILQAVEQLCRQRRGPEMRAALRTYAPSWLTRVRVRFRAADRSTAAVRASQRSEEELIDDLLDAFAAVTEELPLLLVLEDLHRCDARTKSLVRRLTQRYDAVRLLMIGTYRTDASDALGASSRAAWQDLVTRGKAYEIPLAPLDRADVEAYLAERHPGIGTPRFVDWTYRHSRGNPALLRALMEELAARGAIRHGEHGWEVPDVDRIGNDDSAPPDAVRVANQPGPIVGRDVERSRLEAAWRQVQSGQRRTVLIAGEPGIGKTTVVRRFLDDVAAAPGLPPHVIVGRCTEQRSRTEAYMPVLDMFESWRRDDASGAVAEQLLRLAPHWARHIPGVELRTAATSAMVAVDARPERMMREAAALLEALSQTQPLALVLEDAHWADPATIDLLWYVATRTVRARLLIVATFRPVEAEAQPQLLRLDVAARDDIERIDLGPLSPAEIRVWLESVFDHSAAVVDHLAAEATRRSSGNPLFLQAVTRSLAASGCVERTTDGWKVGTSALRHDEVPAELSGLIASQLCLLPEALRELLNVACVAGEQFDAASVAGALERPIADVDAELTAEAQRSALILPAGTSHWPDGTTGGRYRFRHALYQQSLYDALPPHDRAHRHRLVGAAIERGCANRLAPVTTELAEHYSAGGEHAAAATYLERSALLMIERSALREAIGYFERALDALACLPESDSRRLRQLQNHIGCGLSRGLLEGPQSARVKQHTDFIAALLPKVDDPAVALPSQRLLWFYDLFHWNYAGMARTADAMMLRSATPTDPAYRALALSMRGITACYRGEVQAARRDLEASLKLCDDPHRLPSAVDWVIDARVETRCYLAWVLWLNGQPDRSQRRLVEGLRLAEEGDHESTRCAALWFAASISQLRRDPIADTYMELLDEYSNNVGLPIWRQFTMVLLAVAQLEQGDERTLDALLTTLAEAGDQPSAVIARAYLLGQLALAYGRRGDAQHGIALVDFALSRIRTNGARVSESDLLRIRGDLQQTVGDQRAAEASYEEALQVARNQGARAFELRAAVARARLYDTGATEGRNAIEELEAIYDTFRDGFDTHDLVEAQRLLRSDTSRRPQH